MEQLRGERYCVYGNHLQGIYHLVLTKPFREKSSSYLS